jgi:hypothetical protein
MIDPWSLNMQDGTCHIINLQPQQIPKFNRKLFRDSDLAHFSPCHIINLPHHQILIFNLKLFIEICLWLISTHVLIVHLFRRWPRRHCPSPSPRYTDRRNHCPVTPSSSILSSHVQSSSSPHSRTFQAIYIISIGSFYKINLFSSLIYSSGCLFSWHWWKLDLIVS